MHFIDLDSISQKVVQKIAVTITNIEERLEPSKKTLNEDEPAKFEFKFGADTFTNEEKLIAQFCILIGDRMTNTEDYIRCFQPVYSPESPIDIFRDKFPGGFKYIPRITEIINHIMRDMLKDFALKRGNGLSLPSNFFAPTILKDDIGGPVAFAKYTTFNDFQDIQQSIIPPPSTVKEKKKKKKNPSSKDELKEKKKKVLDHYKLIWINKKK